MNRILRRLAAAAALSVCLGTTSGLAQKSPELECAGLPKPLDCKPKQVCEEKKDTRECRDASCEAAKSVQSQLSAVQYSQCLASQALEQSTCATLNVKIVTALAQCVTTILSGDGPTTKPPLPEATEWRFDVFYCHPLDGDAARAKPFAERVADIIKSQSTIGPATRGAVRVAAFPPAGTITKVGGVYGVEGKFSIHTTPNRKAVSDALKTLLDPVAADDNSEFRFTTVGTEFPRYASVVVCPGWTPR